jgi:hypothetical protein
MQKSKQTNKQQTKMRGNKNYITQNIRIVKKKIIIILTCGYGKLR